MTVENPDHTRAESLWPSRPQVRPRTSHLGFLVLVLTVLTIVRLIGLRLSVVDLFYDEAQYWSWSRDLAFGYYSKPPLLAWLIAVAEQACGSAEWCVRAPAPILYCATSLVVYAIGRTALRRAGRILGRPAHRLRDRRGVLGAHRLDRRAAGAVLGALAPRLCEAPGRAALALGRAARASPWGSASWRNTP